MQQKTFELNEQTEIYNLKTQLHRIAESYAILTAFTYGRNKAISDRISQIKIKTEDDLTRLRLGVAFAEAIRKLDVALNVYANKINPDAEDLVNIHTYQEEFIKLIAENKSTYNKKIDDAQRTILIERAAIIIGGIAFLAISISFITLAPDLFLVGFFAGALPAMLIPVFLNACLQGKYKNEYAYFSLLSKAENISDNRSKQFPTIFKMAKDEYNKKINTAGLDESNTLTI